MILTLNLVATAYAWYLAALPAPGHARGWRRRLGALFIAFAPSMVSHANAHLNWTAGWLVPLMVWRVFAAARPGRWLRDGLILGVLVAVAFSIAAEGLFFIALACAGLPRRLGAAQATRAEARAASAGRCCAGSGSPRWSAFALLAYPIWMHFLGPQRFARHRLRRRACTARTSPAYVAFPQRSLAGDRRSGHLAGAQRDRGELVLRPAAGAAHRGRVLVPLARSTSPGRRATLRALGVTALVFAVLSWGPAVKIFKNYTDIPLPYALLDPLPVFNAALPTRLALVVTPIVGLLLALLGRRPAAAAGSGLAAGSRWRWCRCCRSTC